jgi:hypothetical protein
MAPPPSRLCGAFPKADRAETVIGGTVSVPVLNEQTNVARRDTRLSRPAWRAPRGR